MPINFLIDCIFQFFIKDSAISWFYMRHFILWNNLYQQVVIFYFILNRINHKPEENDVPNIFTYIILDQGNLIKNSRMDNWSVYFGRGLSSAALKPFFFNLEKLIFCVSVRFLVWLFSTFIHESYTPVLLFVIWKSYKIIYVNYECLYWAPSFSALINLVILLSQRTALREKNIVLKGGNL